MPIFTIRLDEKAHSGYLEHLKNLMAHFGHKTATKTFEASVCGHESLLKRIDELETENINLSMDLNRHMNAIQNFIQAEAHMKQLF